MNTHLPYTTVLFDLDGTLTDPYDGIVRSVNYALERLGRPMPDERFLRSVIGPPLRDSFVNLLGEEFADEGVRIYRERYLTIGLYENSVYPGIPELLADLRAAGVRLFVATSKLIEPTHTILEHFGLAPYFEGVSGATLDGRVAHKADVIKALLPQIGSQPGRAVMVGDTPYDVYGARRHGLPCIVVGYGFGERHALHAAEPLAYAATVAELRRLLLADSKRTQQLRP
jgi:phosphoglycolate phosphatase